MIGLSRGGHSDSDRVGHNSSCSRSSPSQGHDTRSPSNYHDHVTPFPTSYTNEKLLEIIHMLGIELLPLPSPFSTSSLGHVVGSTLSLQESGSFE